MSLGIPEGTSQVAPFKERHPVLSSIPEGDFPRTVGLRLDPKVTAEFQPLLKSALATALEYRDSPIEDLQVIIPVNGDSVFSTYATNYLEGYLSSAGAAQLTRNNVSVSWEGSRAGLSNASVRRIEDAENASPTNPDLRLHLVFGDGPEKQPNLIIDPVISERVVGDQNKVVTFPEFTTSAVDAAIASLAVPPQSTISE